MKEHKETMLEAFLRQTGIDDVAADYRDDASSELGTYFAKKANQDIKHGPRVHEIVPPPTEKPDLEVKRYDRFSDLIAEALNATDPKPGEKGFLEIDRVAYLRNKKAPK